MKRHPFDPFSLLFGALFVSVGVAFLAGSTLGEAWRSIWPMVAVVVGTTLAAWAAVSAFHQRQPVSMDIAFDDCGPGTDEARDHEPGTSGAEAEEEEAATS